MIRLLLAAIALANSMANTSLSDSSAVGSPSSETVSDQADIPLQTGLYEPFVREGCAAGITVLYKANLDRDVDFERTLPGVHAAMIEAALASAKATADVELAKAKALSRAELHRGLKPQQLGRLAYLFGPFVKRNSGRALLVRPDDTMTAAVQRWQTGLAEDSGYQARLKRIAAEPGMIKALNVAAPIITNYSQKMQSIGLIAMQSGVRSAKAKANAMAQAKGLATPYP